MKSIDYAESEFEMDGWARWDMPSNDYYDIAEFPEGYTGYDGSMIWEFIHNRICFTEYRNTVGHWKADFNKAVSGLHSLISAQIVRGIAERIEAGESFKDDEVWRDPTVEFQRRLSASGETPLALENLYFTYMLFLTAAAKVKDRLLADSRSTMMGDDDAASSLQAFLENPILKDASIEVPVKKLHNHALQATDTLWEGRIRTQDLLRIMNCVQCNKCRLHGKIAMMGLSTALQIHLGRAGEGADISRLRRVELAALLSTLFKFSKAVEFSTKMCP